MDKRGISVWQSNGQSGGQYGPLSRGELDIHRGHDVCARVAGQGVAGQWDVWIEPPHQNFGGLVGIGHSGQGYPRQVSDRAADDKEAARQVTYHERLYVPWWWWPVSLGLGGLMAAELHSGRSGLWGVLPYLIMLPAVVAALAWMGRLPVGVRDGELWVDDAHLPVRFISDVETLDEAGRRVMLGPRGDPAAFVVLRPWVRHAVVVALDDPDDPTPYWLGSTRHAAGLAAALNRARGVDQR